MGTQVPVPQQFIHAHLAVLGHTLPSLALGAGPVWVLSVPVVLKTVRLAGGPGL